MIRNFSTTPAGAAGAASGNGTRPSFTWPIIALSDPQYLQLADFCRHKNWPMLIHCSGESPRDFYDVAALAKHASNIPVIVSHFGGIRQVGEDAFEVNRRLLTERAEFLQTAGAPENLFINLAIPDQKVAADVVLRFPGLAARLVASADAPFLGSLEEYRAAVSEAFGESLTETIRENGRQLLGQFAKARVDV